MYVLYVYMFSSMRALPVVEMAESFTRCCGETQHGVRGVGGVHAAELLDGLQLLLARLYHQAELPRVQ